MRELRSTVAHLADSPASAEGFVEAARAQRHRRRINARLAAMAAADGQGV
jgi:hypothetical protein